MNIQDYIAGLPVAVDGPTGRLGNHAVVHAGLQDHEARLATVENSQTLRLDTTVGTRIFAGTQMILGDTGWRLIPTINGWSGAVWLRRIGNEVFIRGQVSAAEATSAGVIDLPAGFRAGILHAHGLYSYGGTLVGPQGTTPAIKRASLYANLFSIQGYAAEHTYTVDSSWLSDNPWPNALPGTPA